MSSLVKVLSRKIIISLQIPFELVPDLRTYLYKLVHIEKFMFDKNNGLEIIVDEDNEEKLYAHLTQFLKKKNFY